MPDQNDIVFEQYQIDFVTLGRAVFDAFGGSGITFDTILSALNTGWLIFIVLSFVFAAVCLYGIIYAYLRFNELSEIENQQLLDQQKLYKELYKGEPANSRWADIEEHIQGENPHSWKLAIIEADIMLGEILDEAGYAGATIGEKLKSASPTQFTTLDDAWRAHRVRNQIAHEGADFVLTKKLANETITQYRRVFAEFGVI